MMLPENETQNNKTEEVRDIWDNFCDMYSELIEPSNVKGTVSCYQFSRARFAKRICEVGCGTGRGPIIFIPSYMKEGAVFYTSDLSPEMINKYEQNFNESDLSKIDSVRFTRLPPSDEIKVQAPVDGDTNKHVFMTEANNECLPYEDNSFDVYIANLSIMVVDDYKNMLSESYRVLDTNGVMAFTTPGNPENSKILTIYQEAIHNLYPEVVPPERDLFHLNDKPRLKRDLEDLGYKKIKMYYEPATVPFTKNELYQVMINHWHYIPQLEQLNEDQKKAVKTEFERLYDHYFGDDSLLAPSVEILVVIATK